MMNEEATVKITCELLNAKAFSIHLGKYHGVTVGSYGKSILVFGRLRPWAAVSLRTAWAVE